MAEKRPVRVRLAPSPTGDPHVGTAWVALFNVAFARREGGKFVLRIEDTDRARSTPEAERAIIEALHWLGLQWDEGPDVGGPFGPYRQSERREIYEKYARQLLDEGKAYRCFCTSERLAQMRREQGPGGQQAGYDGLCRRKSDEEVKKLLAAGTPHVIRLKVPKEKQTIFRDLLREPTTFDNAQVDDQVLVKSDGFPTYHLANVVDDHLMEISHVIRGEDWIPSCPKHIILYEFFGWEVPVMIHLPLLRNPDKSKLSKRKNPTSILHYRRAGFMPEALRNFLGLMGWNMPDGREKFSLEEMIKEFTWDRISLGGPVFDVEKLTWLNEQYLRELSDEAMAERLGEALFSKAYLARIAPLVRERISKWEDFVGYGDYFFTGAVNYDAAMLVPKKRTAAEILPMLEKVGEIFDELATWTAPVLEEKLRAIQTELGWKINDVLMPIRVALTGKTATPPLMETMEVLGKDICRRRIRVAVQKLRSES